MTGEEFVLMIMLPSMGGWVVGMLIFCLIFKAVTDRQKYLCKTCGFTFSTKPGACKKCIKAGGNFMRVGK